MRARGFTLIELVVVISITGILAAALTVFLRPALDSYFDTRRRAELSEMADTALRRMGQDVRLAVPNSIRLQSPTCFQLVPTIAGGRYRKDRDMTSATTGVDAPLDTTTATTSFDVFNRIRTLPASPIVGDWVVINNQNSDDVYNGVNRAVIAGIQTPPSPGGVTVGQHRFSIASQRFSPGYDGGRFVVVANAAQTVFYSCIGDTLYRTVAAFGADRVTTCAATAGDIVARNVQTCIFTYDPNAGATQQSGYLQMRLTLMNQTEVVTLLHGAHVENAP